MSKPSFRLLTCQRFSCLIGTESQRVLNHEYLNVKGDHLSADKSNE